MDLFSPLKESDFGGKTLNCTSIKQSLKKALSDIDNAFLAKELSITDVLSKRSLLIERCLTLSYGHFFESGIYPLSHPNDAPSLFAYGGLARYELFPYSDTDLLIVTVHSDNKLAKAIEGFVGFCWDIELAPSIGVRTLEECQASMSELSDYTNMLCMRAIIDKQQQHRKILTLLNEHPLYTPAHFLLAKTLERDARYTKYNDTQYQLEPNIKESCGFLRDIHLIGWLSLRYTGGSDIQNFCQHHLLQEEVNIIKQATTCFNETRYILHLCTTQNRDRLFFDHQHLMMSTRLGFKVDNAPVSLYMQKVLCYAKDINTITNNLILSLKQNTIITPPLPTPLSLADLYEGLLHMANSQESPVWMNDVGILKRLCVQKYPFCHSLVDLSNRVHRDFLISVFNAPYGILALEFMHQYHLLTLLIPDMAYITGQMQFDMYHTYPVDKHILQVLKNLYALKNQGGELTFSLSSLCFDELPTPYICFFAALFHDIGKGQPGDHSSLGEQGVNHFCRTLGLSEEDTQKIAWLVLNHLLMSTVAQKQDIQDGQVLEAFALQVQTLERLHSLYLLTVADIYGTNPTLWNGWRESLLQELYLSTKHLLENRGLGIDENGGYPQLDAWLDSQPTPIKLPTVDIQPHSGGFGTDVYIYASSSHHLFAYLAKAFSQMRLNIVEARFKNIGDACLNLFVILEANGTPIGSSARLAEIKLTLEQLLGGGKISSAAVNISHRMTTRVKRNQGFASVDCVNTQDRSILQISSLDFPGLLSRIGKAFIECDVFVHGAKIITLGELVEDTFYISKMNESRPLNPAEQQQLKTSILQHLKA